MFPHAQEGDASLLWVLQASMSSEYCGAILRRSCIHASPNQPDRRGSFETPVISGQFLDIVAGSQPAGFSWQVTSGGVDISSTGTFGTAFDGKQFLDLDGYVPGAISQSFTATPGAAYMLSFAYANNPYGTGIPSPSCPSGGACATIPASATVFVSDSGSGTHLISPLQLSHGSSTVTNLNWTASGSIVFVADGTSTTLSFVSNDPASSDGGIYLDAISVTTAPAQQTTGNDFVPVTPCRLVDTRNPNGAFGGPSITGGSSRAFVIPSGPCGIPSRATAYSVNVTVVPHGPLGYLTIWPSGQSQPVASTLNSDGRIKANAAVVPAGSNGAVSVYATNTTDVILDINGYFVPESTAGALSLYTLPPCRIADTRNPAGVLGGPSLVAASVRTFPVLSSACDYPQPHKRIR
jgi:hypothetical protein